MKKDDISKPSQEQVTTSRRRLLKSLTLGGAAVTMLPGQWTKPVAQSGVLPAHAQSTPVGGDGDCSINSASFLYGGGTFCACIRSLAVTADCGGTAQMDIIFDGNSAAGCISSAGGAGAVFSWSCSASGTSPAGLTSGDSVTFVVSWASGCSCSVVRTVF